MATVSIVDPLGGGDFTTLQAWEDWADDQASAAQWAECYTGGDLGSCDFSGWSASPSASDYPRIYTLLSERHVGRPNTGAYTTGVIQTSGTLDYVRVEGVRFDIETGYGFFLVNCDDWFLDSNLFRHGSGTTAAVYFTAQNVTIDSFVVQNSIVYGANIGSSDGFLLSSSPTAADTYLTVELYNNTIVSCGQYGIRLNGTSGGGPDPKDGFVTATVKNCVVMDSATEDFSDNGTNVTISAANNNLSSDDTGDDWGATGSLVNKSSSDQFVSVWSNVALRTGADALDAGADLSGSFDWDAVHVECDDWRPQGASWDMGALEGEVTPPLLGACVIIS